LLFLIQNGVFPAREGSQYNDRLKRLAGQKVRILADGFSLRERAIHHVVSGIEKIEMKDFVRLLFEPGVKAVWH
jgi:sulfur relay protein TusB/DsrH